MNEWTTIGLDVETNEIRSLRKSFVSTSKLLDFFITDDFAIAQARGWQTALLLLFLSYSVEFE